MAHGGKLMKILRMNSLLILVVELILTLCACLAFIAVSRSAETAEAGQFTSEVIQDYSRLEKGYLSAFKALIIPIREKADEGISFDEMQNYLQSNNDTYAETIGRDVFDGLAITYKGGYAHSWDYGDYSDYDPATRIWYQQAEAAGGEAVLVAPYVSYLGADSLNSDQLIEISIAQKYNDEVSFDLDLKINDISRILTSRNFLYPGTEAIFYNPQGFILSTNNDSLYSRNVQQEGGDISKAMVSALSQSQKLPDRMHLMQVDGQPQYLYSSVDGEGNTCVEIIPLLSVFLRNMLLPLLISLLLILLEIIIYTKNRIDNADAKRRSREELEEALQQAKSATEAKSEFLSRMSHDMRTPLNGIIGMTYLAKCMDNPPETRDYLNKIDTSSQFLLGLVNDILDMSKVESNKIELKPEPYPFATLKNYLNAVIVPLCETKSIRFAQDLHPDPDHTPLMDTLRGNQIIFNLFSNAVKYTPEGGMITFRFYQKMVQDDRMRMRMKISDNGIGMSEEFQKVLFEPFTQENRNDVSEQRGTGLGLAIVKKMVTLMGGTISVDSRVGEGTTFVMEGEYPCIRNKELPRNDKMRDAEKNDRGVLHGKRVLVCEDHPMNREIIMALLEKEKMIIDMAEDGEIGEKMFAASAEGYYDIILMDIRMPNQNGYEATAAIRAMKRGDAGTVPIIAMTADAFEQDIQKCLAAGMNGHLPKPISPRQLNDMLVRHLSGMAEKTG